MVLVNVDCGKRTTKGCERTGERPAASADLQDRPFGVSNQPRDVIDRGFVRKKILAEFVAATVL